MPVDSRSKPLEPVGIEGCEVLWNPFEDIVPRVQVPTIPQVSPIDFPPS